MAEKNTFGEDQGFPPQENGKQILKNSPALLCTEGKQLRQTFRQSLALIVVPINSYGSQRHPRKCVASAHWGCEVLE